jgi:hypothetical protein
LFLQTAPAYITGAWPAIGSPNTLNNQSIAAKERWSSSEKTQCTSVLIPVDCVVSDWSEWSDCSAECGGGTQTRTRTIVTPAQNGGTVCDALIETRECNMQSSNIYYFDADNDAYGSTDTIHSCAASAPVGFAANNADCNDNDSNIHPGAVDIADNGIDEDCDGNEVVTAISEIKNTFGLSIFPNPASNYLLISGKIKEELTARIYTVEGKILLTKKLEIGDKHQLDISSVVSGSYILEVSDKEHKAAKRIVVIK